MARMGSFLENIMADIFRKAGFSVVLNTHKYGFETDVLASKGSYHIIIECKQYENAYINVGSLLHQWASKGHTAKADKTIVAIAGMNLSSEDYRLAKQLGIYLFDDKIIHNLNLMDKEEVRVKLNDLIQFDEQRYKEKRDKETKKVLIISGIIFVLFVIGFFALKTYLQNNPTALWIILGIALYVLIIFVGATKGKRRGRRSNFWNKPMVNRRILR